MCCYTGLCDRAYVENRYVEVSSNLSEELQETPKNKTAKKILNVCSAVTFACGVVVFIPGAIANNHAVMAVGTVFGTVALITYLSATYIFPCTRVEFDFSHDIIL